MYYKHIIYKNITYIFSFNINTNIRYIKKYIPYNHKIHIINPNK